MTSEAKGPESTPTTRHDVASAAAQAPLAAPALAASGDGGLAIGYEAADPALQAWWSEAMLAASRGPR